MSDPRSKQSRKMEAHAEYVDWLGRMNNSGIANVLSSQALVLLFITLGNGCWREERKVEESANV